MPAIWSSSERPISVRMVWVDGVRHAILSRDDPLLSVKSVRRRPQTTSLVTEKNYPLKFEPYKPAGQAEGGSEICLLKLRLVGEKSQTEGLESTGRSLSRRQSAPSDARSACNETEALVSQEAHLLFEEKARCANTLLERVLCWLDLSGKVRAWVPEENGDAGLGETVGEATSQRKYSTFKEEGSCMKILVPRQFLMLRNSADFEQSEASDSVSSGRRVREESRTRDVGMLADKNAEDLEVCSDEGSRSRSSWLSSSRRPQLHIFMPTLKPTEIHWLSSQESLFCD